MIPSGILFARNDKTLQENDMGNTYVFDSKWVIPFNLNTRELYSCHYEHGVYNNSICTRWDENMSETFLQKLHSLTRLDGKDDLMSYRRD